MWHFGEEGEAQTGWRTTTAFLLPVCSPNDKVGAAMLPAGFPYRKSSPRREASKSIIAIFCGLGCILAIGVLLSSSRIAHDLTSPNVNMLYTAEDAKLDSMNMGLTDRLAMATRSMIDQVEDGKLCAPPLPIKFGSDHSDARCTSNPKPIQALEKSSAIFSFVEVLTDGDRNARILRIGFGSSSSTEKVYEKGYQRIKSIEISAVVEQMLHRINERALLTQAVMDATKMESLMDKSFDLVIDEAFLDTLSESKGVLLTTATYLKEVQRILRPGAWYLCISSLSLTRWLLDFPHLEFGCSHVEMPPHSDADDTRRPHFAYLCQKPKMPVGKAEEWPEVEESVLRSSEKDWCEKALSHNPENAFAWSLMGRGGGCEVDGRKYSEKDCVAKALSLVPDHAAGRRNLGILGGGEVDSQRYSEKECLEEALSLVPANAAVWTNLGLSGGGPKYSGKECFERSLVVDPEGARSWYRLGGFGGGLIDGQKYSGKECFEKFLSLVPQNADGWNDLGSLGGGKVGSQIFSEKECFEKSLSLLPGDGTVWTNLGISGGGEIGGCRFSEKECYEMSVSLHPKEVRAWYSLGGFGGVSVNGQAYSNKECLAQALSLDPKAAFIWNGLGSLGGVEVDGQKYSEKECFEKSLSSEPEDSTAWHSLGILSGGDVDGQKYSEKECFEKSLSIFSEQPVLWNNLGSLGGGEVDGQRYSETQCYEKSLSLEPEQVVGWIELGSAGGGEVNSQRYSGKECFTHALSNDPKVAFAWCSLGHVGGGELDCQRYSAKECYGKGLSLDIEDSTAWYNLGVLGGGEVDGQRQLEKHCYQKALSLDPKKARAWYNLGVLGGGQVDDRMYSETECNQKALSLDETGALAQEQTRLTVGIVTDKMSKEIYFVRHAQAAHNPHIDAGLAEKDDQEKREQLLRAGRSILDPELTEEGQNQAKELRNKVEAEGMNFDVLVTTPLARTIQTSHIAFEGFVSKWIITPLMTESARPDLGGPQKGRTLENIRASFPFVSDWDFSELKEGENWIEQNDELGGAGYVHPKTSEERLPEIVPWLKSLPFERIVVVGHSGVLNKILGESLGNCQMKAMTV